MQFLSDVYLRCPDCDGRRYRSEVLDVKISPQRRAGAGAGKTSAGNSARTPDDQVGDGTGADTRNIRGRARPGAGLMAGPPTRRPVRPGAGLMVGPPEEKARLTGRKLDGGSAHKTDGVSGPPRSVADILEMTIEDALSFFAESPDIVRALAPLAAVGLD